MKITLSKESPTAVVCDVLAVGVGSSKPTQDATIAKLDRAMNGSLIALMKEEEFKGKKNQRLELPAHGRVKAKRLLLVGLGDGKSSPQGLRLLGSLAGRSARSRGSLAVVSPASEPEELAALAEGIATGCYRYSRYLTGSRKPKRSLRKASIVVSDTVSTERRRAVSDGVAAGEAVNLARDMVNCPPNDLTASELANIAREQSREVGITCKVSDKKAIEKLGMHLLLAVNRGSQEEPRFIHMTYKPKAKASSELPRVVFVGKGLTFDSGGLCLKPAGSMLDMKCDMAGAATTIATVIGAARLKLPVEVHGIVGSTDNMNGADAYRPGDVFPSLDGKTVEIINTDAEGRLVLADALAYARKLEPTYLIDHATLTGACMVALGSFTAGLFSDDKQLAERYQQAAEAAGEPVWRLPLARELREQLKSDIADLKHTGGRYGGSITAALFLKEFAGETKWLHMDIAGPAFLDRTQGLHPKGGTGFGVRTALEFLKAL